MKTLKGVIHGRAIELEEETGLSEGQEVNVTIEPVARRQGATADAVEALKRAVGSWADDPEGLDRYLEWNRRQRKVSRGEMPE